MPVFRDFPEGEWSLNNRALYIGCFKNPCALDFFGDFAKSVIEKGKRERWEGGNFEKIRDLVLRIFPAALPLAGPLHRAEPRSRKSPRQCLSVRREPGSTPIKAMRISFKPNTCACA